MKYILIIMLCMSSLLAGEAPAKKVDQTKVSDETRKALPTADELKLIDKAAMAVKHNGIGDLDEKSKVLIIGVMQRVGEGVEYCTDADWAARVDAECKVADIWHKYNKGNANVADEMLGGGQ